MNVIEASDVTTSPALSDTGRAGEAAGLNNLVDLINSPELNDGATPVVDPMPQVQMAPPAIVPGASPFRAPRPYTVPAPQPLPVKIKFPARIYTTGRLKAGKDHVLAALGCKVFGFADPLYALQELFFGSADKSLPGAREFLQKVGQWGRGLVNAQYPLTPERAVFTTMIRTMGPAGLIPKDFLVSWEDYGKEEGLWVRALLARVNQNGLQGLEIPKIGVSNVRFANEQAALKEAGFTGFHVTCSTQTLVKRLTAVGLDPKSLTVNDTSEALAKTVETAIQAELRKNPRGAKLRVIWSDESAPCPSPRFITMAEVDAAR